jgi:1-acyl-sn-glycerol-3-phosphate acyltransferase
MLILAWLPLLGIIRLLDRTPARLRTGRWFRRLGMAIVKVNPAWTVHVSGEHNAESGRPYLVLSNHFSLADIPLISLLPWEMKWIAKAELFRLPFIGWMMRMAGDIPVDRRSRRGAQALLQAKSYLQQRCPVMVFPEGTRSVDGRVYPFTDGVFQLAIKTKVPILPVAVEGSQACLPKGSWKIGKPQDIFLKVFPPIDTSNMTGKDVTQLRDRVRQMIVEQIAHWRGTDPEAVDALN